MPALKPQETQAVAELAQALYSFLPGKAHPYSKPKMDFGIVASSVGIGPLWSGGSKQPAIENLLESTLQARRDRFCPLMIRIVQEGLKYRRRKNEPITQEELTGVNVLIARLGFKIPELVDRNFISTLPREKSASPVESKIKIEPLIEAEQARGLREQFLKISGSPPHERGYAFERFLYQLFDAYGFNPRPSFRIEGEQIDGSIEFDREIYLIEAKWQQEPITQADLLVLDGRVSGHSGIGRGIFIGAGCFSKEGIAAYQRLRPSSMIGIDGQDLFLILERALPLDKVLRRKVRHLIETGNFHLPVFAIIPDLVAPATGH